MTAATDQLRLGIGRHLNPNLALGFAASLMDIRPAPNNLDTLNMLGAAVSTYASYVLSAFWGDRLQRCRNLARSRCYIWAKRPLTHHFRPSSQVVQHDAMA